MAYFSRFKEKWQITSNFQVVIICIVFSITGSLAVWVAKPMLGALHIQPDTLNPWLYWPLRIFIILPCYQVLLIIVGTVFGQFRFFWAFEKKTVGRMFRRRAKAASGA